MSTDLKKDHVEHKIDHAEHKHDHEQFKKDHKQAAYDHQVAVSSIPNQNLLYGIIITLLMIIAIGWFFLGMKLGENWSAISGWTNLAINGSGAAALAAQVDEDLVITIIDDQRCTNCPTEQVTQQLKQVPALANVTFEEKDFTDEWVEAFMQANGITLLPAVVFSSNQVTADIAPYLTETDAGQYNLQVDAKFNPFQERSENWFLILDQLILSQVKDGAYIDGNQNAAITWVEYSDLECPFCAKLHNDGTPEEVKEEFGDQLNIAFQHFPLGFHPNALPGAQIAECVGETQWSEAFFSLIDVSFEEKRSTERFLLDEAEKLGADRAAIEACLDENRYKEKVEQQMALGTDTFGVTGTPWNVLINNQTGEYEVISGAYPADTFIETIERLLWNTDTQDSTES